MTSSTRQFSPIIINVVSAVAINWIITVCKLIPRIEVPLGIVIPPESVYVPGKIHIVCPDNTFDMAD